MQQDADSFGSERWARVAHPSRLSLGQRWRSDGQRPGRASGLSSRGSSTAGRLLVPTSWPDTDDPLLILDLPSRRTGGASVPAALPAGLCGMPELAKFGLWLDGDVSVPRLDNVFVAFGASEVAVYIDGFCWARRRVSIADWASHETCLLGVTTGLPRHLTQDGYAGVFAELLEDGQALIGEAQLLPSGRPDLRSVR